MGHPVVVHPLGVFGVTHDAGDKHPAIDLEFIAHNPDYGDPFAGPFLLIEDFKAVNLAPLNLAPIDLAGLGRRQAHLGHLGRFGRVGVVGLAVGVQIERGFLVLGVKILRDADGVLINPLADRLVADTLRHK